MDNHIKKTPGIGAAIVLAGVAGYGVERYRNPTITAEQVRQTPEKYGVSNKFTNFRTAQTALSNLEAAIADNVLDEQEVMGGTKKHPYGVFDPWLSEETNPLLARLPDCPHIERINDDDYGRNTLGIYGVRAKDVIESKKRENPDQPATIQAEEKWGKPIFARVRDYQEVIHTAEAKGYEQVCAQETANTHNEKIQMKSLRTAAIVAALPLIAVALIGRKKDERGTY